MSINSKVKLPTSNKTTNTSPAPVVERKRRISKEVSVMGWIEDIHGAVLLVKQKRGRKLWSLPGGKINSSEALERGLAREIQEETSLKVKHCSFIGLMDRPEKSNLTMLYRVTVQAGGAPVAQRSEIAEIKFRASLPRDATPSLQFFWRLLHSNGPHAR